MNLESETNEKCIMLDYHCNKGVYRKQALSADGKNAYSLYRCDGCGATWWFEE